MEIRIDNEVYQAVLENLEASNGNPMGRRFQLILKDQILKPEDLFGKKLWIVSASDEERKNLYKAGIFISDEPWGMRLTRIRESHKMTQAQLGKEIGMPQSSIAALEARYCQPNSKTIMEKLRKVLPEL